MRPLTVAILVLALYTRDGDFATVTAMICLALKG
jgi:hypothetical protein